MAGSSCWAVTPPTLDNYLEELKGPDLEVVPCGPRNGIPVALGRKCVFRFDEHEPREHKAELMTECEAIAVAARRAAGFDELDAWGEVGLPPGHEDVAEDEADGARKTTPTCQRPDYPVHSAAGTPRWRGLDRVGGPRRHQTPRRGVDRCGGQRVLAAWRSRSAPSSRRGRCSWSPWH